MGVELFFHNNLRNVHYIKSNVKNVKGLQFKACIKEYESALIGHPRYQVKNYLNLRKEHDIEVSSNDVLNVVLLSFSLQFPF